MYSKTFNEGKYRFIVPILDKLKALEEGKVLTIIPVDSAELSKIRYLFYDWGSFYPEEKKKYRLKVFGGKLVFLRLRTTPGYGIKEEKPFPEKLRHFLEKMIVEGGGVVEVLLEEGKIEEEDALLLREEFEKVMA